METGWTGRKKTKINRNRYFSFGPCSFHIEWHLMLKLFLVLFQRCSFQLIPKISWTITYSWLQLSWYTYSFIRCFGCSFVCKYTKSCLMWTNRIWLSFFLNNNNLEKYRFSKISAISEILIECNHQNKTQIELTTKNIQQTKNRAHNWNLDYVNYSDFINKGTTYLVLFYVFFKLNLYTSSLNYLYTKKFGAIKKTDEEFLLCNFTR